MATKPIKPKRRKLASTPLTRTQSRYRFKEGHADRVKANSKKQYRKSKGSEFELTGSIVLRALTFIDDEARMLAVENKLSGGTTTQPIFSQQRLAELLDTTYQTIWRWSSQTDQLPEPNLIDNTEGRGRGVYHLEEVRVIVAAIGEHLKAYKYYRKDHVLTRDKVFNEIEALRNVNYGDTTHGYQENRKAPSVKSKSGTRRRRLKR
jgi:hypothetical protein